MGWRHELIWRDSERKRDDSQREAASAVALDPSGSDARCEFDSLFVCFSFCFVNKRRPS